MRAGNGDIIHGPGDVYDLVAPELSHLDHEVVKLIMLDAHNRLIGCETISTGEAETTLLRPREVFASALKNSAASIVLVHNHPSGSPEPSKPDIDLTRRIARIGRELGVLVQDHVIIGKGGYVSLMARHILKLIR
ncbi:MAG: JAB domain-containing protein [Candidatus Hadarchaeales archaeon]